MWEITIKIVVEEIPDPRTIGTFWAETYIEWLEETRRINQQKWRRKQFFLR